MLAGVLAFAPVSHGTVMDVCTTMMQAIAPASGATVTIEQRLGAGGGVMRVFRLAKPIGIGAAQAEGLWELGGSVRAVIRFSDATAAGEFARALAEEYGQSLSPRSRADWTTYQVGLSKPFASATTAVRGRNVQFYCSFEKSRIQEDWLE